LEGETGEPALALAPPLERMAGREAAIAPPALTTPPEEGLRDTFLGPATLAPPNQASASKLGMPAYLKRFGCGGVVFFCWHTKGVCVRERERKGRRGLGSPPQPRQTAAGRQ
jgi:hypothetical protein